MERLTDNTNYCSSWSDCEIAEGKCVFYGNCYDRKIYNKLREYEDLEEQGLLLKLPCKVGTELYFVGEHANGVREILSVTVNSIGDSLSYKNNIGKGIFLSKAEAEAALAKLSEVE